MVTFARALGALLVYCLPLAALGQAQDSVRWLREVAVYGLPEAKYAAGSKVFRPDSAVLAQLRHGALPDLLMQHTPVYVREYGGPGMLATVSFRGTSPSHTALLWNGINLNQPTLGMIDYSLVPLAAGDQVEVQAGGGSGRFGTDALGGSIHLYSQPTWRAGRRFTVQQHVGSFGRYFAHGQARLSWGRWELRSQIYYQRAVNNFPFANITKPGAPTERQPNAATLNHGAIQEIYYKLSESRYLSVKAWHNANDRQVQPNMADAEAQDRQWDRNTRVVADYHDHSRLGYFRGKLAWVRDWLQFNQNTPVATNRYWAALDYEKKLGKKWSLQAGANWQHIVAEVAAYARRVREDRHDLYALLRYQPRPGWAVTANLRQAFVTGFAAPLAPSLGSELTLAKGPNHQLVAKAALSRNYRVPTLNDRYWQPGGNPDLRPELGHSGELGLAWQLGRAGRSVELEATHYRMWVDDWIIWLPQTSFWAPSNIRRARVVGLELSAKWARTLGRWQLAGGGQYALAQSTNRNTLNENDRSLGKQLPYVPLHRATAHAQVGRGQWFGNINFNYTSERFVSTDNDEVLAAFRLVNLGAGRALALGRAQNGAAPARLHLSLLLNNVLNERYQNLRLRAMPGRNYQLSARVEF
jgi:vitamin B12 transporter